MERVSPAHGVGSEEVGSGDVRQECPRLSRCERVQAQLKRRPAVQSALRAQHLFHNTDGRAGKHEHHLLIPDAVFPNGGDQVGEVGLRRQQPRGFIDHDQQRGCLGKPDQEPKSRLPVRERRREQIFDFVAELLADPVGQPGQLTLVTVLAGSREVNRPLGRSETRQQERLTDPPTPPHHGELRHSCLCPRPRTLKVGEFLITTDELNHASIVHGVCTTKSLYYK